VVVTGRGCVSALGVERRAFEQALRSGRGGIGPLHYPNAPGPLNMPVAARVTGFVPEQLFDAKRAAQLDPFAQFALVAAREAMAEAGLASRLRGGGRCAVIVGTGVGGQATVDEMSQRVYGHGGRVHPMTIPRVMASSPASQISTEFGIQGPAFGVTSACSSSNHAIGLGFRMIRDGYADAAIVGGTDCCFSYGHLKAWEALRVTAPDTCRPFSRDRRGLVLGEGAGIFVLEELDHARERGGEALAEIAGFGMSADAGDLVHPAVAGMASAMRAALQDAGAAPEEVDYVNAHGTGTPTNDGMETRALHAVLGPHARAVAISSTKSLHGHALGAAGAIELAATIFALREGIVPPTANYLGPDDECDLDYTPNEPRERRIRLALSNSFAFGGLNAVLAVRQVD